MNVRRYLAGPIQSMAHQAILIPMGSARMAGEILNVSFPRPPKRPFNILWIAKQGLPRISVRPAGPFWNLLCASDLVIADIASNIRKEFCEQYFLNSETGIPERVLHFLNQVCRPRQDSAPWLQAYETAK